MVPIKCFHFCLSAVGWGKGHTQSHVCTTTNKHFQHRCQVVVSALRSLTFHLVTVVHLLCCYSWPPAPSDWAPPPRCNTPADTAHTVTLCVVWYTPFNTTTWQNVSNSSNWFTGAMLHSEHLFHSHTIIHICLIMINGPFINKQSWSRTVPPDWLGFYYHRTEPEESVHRCIIPSCLLWTVVEVLFN